MSSPRSQVLGPRLGTPRPGADLVQGHQQGAAKLLLRTCSRGGARGPRRKGCLSDSKEQVRNLKTGEDLATS